MTPLHTPLNDTAVLCAEYTLDAVRMMIETVRGPARRPTPNPAKHREALEALLESFLQQLQDEGRISTHSATEAAFAPVERVQNTDLVLPLDALGDVGLSALGLQLGQLGLGSGGVSFLHFLTSTVSINCHSESQLL